MSGLCIKQSEVSCMFQSAFEMATVDQAIFDTWLFINGGYGNRETSPTLKWMVGDSILKNDWAVDELRSARN